MRRAVVGDPNATMCCRMWVWCGSDCLLGRVPWTARALAVSSASMRCRVLKTWTSGVARCVFSPEEVVQLGLRCCYLSR